MSREVKIHCDACGKEFSDKLTTPFVVSTAEPGSYCYGRPDVEHPIPFRLGDVCLECREKLVGALNRAVDEIKKQGPQGPFKCPRCGQEGIVSALTEELICTECANKERSATGKIERIYHCFWLEKDGEFQTLSHGAAIDWLRKTDRLVDPIHVYHHLINNHSAYRHGDEVLYFSNAMRPPTNS